MQEVAVQAVDSVPAVLDHRRVLQDLRHRWRAGALTRRARASARGPAGVTDAGVHPPAVRGPAHRGPRISQTMRFRAGGHARAARPADLRGHRGGHQAIWARSTVTGCCVYAAKAPRWFSSRSHQPWGGPSTRRPVPEPAGRSCSTAAAPGWIATPPAACAAWHKLGACRSRGRTRTCSATPSSPPCSMRAWICGMSRSPPATPTRGQPCGTTGPARTSTATQLHPGRVHGLRHLTSSAVRAIQAGRPALPMTAHPPSACRHTNREPRSRASRPVCVPDCAHG
jgi:hypothetical protein